MSKTYTIPALIWEEVLQEYFVANVPGWGKYTIHDSHAPGYCVAEFVTATAGGQPLTARPVSGAYTVPGAKEACQRDFEQRLGAILTEGE